jgi:hypothetical protein
MGLPAPLSPETWTTLALGSNVDPATRERLALELRTLLSDARRLRPAEGTPEETDALLRLSAFGLSAARVLGSEFLRVQRNGINQLLGDLVRKELATAEAERKLALRHIQRAVDRYGVIMETFGAVLGDLPPGSVEGLFDELAHQMRSGAIVLQELDRVSLRFQLDVMVAVDVLDGPIDDLTFWAFRAITDARRVDAIPGVSSAGLRADLARVRARRSWLAWDATQIAGELAPWPTPSR